MPADVQLFPIGLYDPVHQCAERTSLSHILLINRPVRTTAARHPLHHEGSTPWTAELLQVCKSTAVLLKIPHCTRSKSVPNRPLRGRRDQLETLSPQFQCGIFRRTAVSTVFFKRLTRSAAANRLFPVPRHSSDSLVRHPAVSRVSNVRNTFCIFFFSSSTAMSHCEQNT